MPPKSKDSTFRERELQKTLKTKGFFVTDSHFKLVSGKHSDSYIQARLAMMNAQVRRRFTSRGIHLIGKLKPTAFAAFTVGGILLARELAKKSQIPLFVGRRKQDGIEWIGKMKERSNRVVLVEDVLTTAISVNLALGGLETSSVGSVVGILVAVDRSVIQPSVRFQGSTIPIVAITKIPLRVFDPTDCPLCATGPTYINLSNPEQDFQSVLLSQPLKKAARILQGYESVYRTQGETRQLELLNLWKNLVPALIAGLPIARLEEDSRLLHFVRLLSNTANEYQISPKLISDLLGQLIHLCRVRVEDRPIGCSLVLGDVKGTEQLLESRAKISIPPHSHCSQLSTLVPAFDAFCETSFVFIADREGRIISLRRLINIKPHSRREGVDLLRHTTAQTNSLAFVLGRRRGTITAFSHGRLQAVCELSERNGQWEFWRPDDALRDIDRELPGVVPLLSQILEVAREMVDRRWGGLFVFGDCTGLSHTQAKVQIEPQPLEEFSIDELAELGKVDGAVLVSSKGQLRHVGVIIQNVGIGTGQVQTPFGGSRRETARRTSLECKDAGVVYVSQNGAIEVYVRGNSWPIAEPISGIRAH